MAHKLLLNINMFSTVPLYQQVANELSDYIRSGRLSPGERMPSIRGLARQLRLSVDTIKQALQILHGDGLILSWPGSGHYVSKTVAPQTVPKVERNGSDGQHFRLLNEPGMLDNTAHWSYEAEFMTKAFNERPLRVLSETEIKFDFCTLEPAIDWLQGPRWDQAMKRWCNDYLAGSSGYGSAAGLSDLRQEIAAWVKRTRGIDCAAQEVFITSGLQQARDLAARLLVNNGNEVVVEDPCVNANYIAYQSQGAKLIYLPHDEEGIDANRLREVRSAQVAHLFSTAGIPSGIGLSMQRREEIIDWAVENEVVIVEDSFGEGYFYQSIGLPSLFSIAKQREKGPRVVYLGSLSQHIMPMLGMGFVIVPAQLQRAFFRAKWLSDRQPSSVTQGLVLSLMQAGYFDQHALRLLESTRRKRQAVLTALERWPADLIIRTPCHAGFQQVIWFNEQIDDELVCQRAKARGIAVMPMSTTFAAHMPKSGLAISFARMSEEKIADGLNQLLTISLDCRTVDLAVSDPLTVAQPAASGLVNGLVDFAAGDPLAVVQSTTI